MRGLYNNSPFDEIYNSLKNNIKVCSDRLYKETYEGIDPLMRLILSNNGCAFSDNVYAHCDYILDGSYGLYYIIGGKANATNDNYDYVELKGMPYFVIFLDTFMDINDIPGEFDNEISKAASAFMGKSAYFDAIVTIINAFMSTLSNAGLYSSTLSTTAAGFVRRRTPFIIAGKIIKEICGEVNENDIAGIEIKYLLKFVNNDRLFSLSLYGVYELE